MTLITQSLDDDDCVFRPQSQFGIRYSDSGFVSFQAQVFDLQSVVSDFESALT